MAVVRWFETAGEGAWQPAPELPTPEASASPDEHPDARLAVLGDDGMAVAHAALWWRDVPPWPGGRLGCIGGFAARGETVARQLLEAACARLAEEGCSVAVGPMNGNTWRRHRFVTWPGERPPFFLEPWNPPGYPDWWWDAGFAVLSEYSSSRVPLAQGGEDLGAIRARLSRAGISIRPIYPERFEEELRAIHRLSLMAFARNFLYTPLDAASFVAQYARVRSLMRPEFVRLAEAEGELRGFVFAIPDPNAAGGDPGDVIVKTLAVQPGRRFAGLGSVLVDDVVGAAREAGFRFAIYALQHDSNRSRRITERHAGALLRRYALFSRALVRP